jgi:hypothetical protein
MSLTQISHGVEQVAGKIAEVPEKIEAAHHEAVGGLIGAGFNNCLRGHDHFRRSALDERDGAQALEETSAIHDIFQTKKEKLELHEAGKGPGFIGATGYYALGLVARACAVTDAAIGEIADDFDRGYRPQIGSAFSRGWKRTARLPVIE